MVSPARGGGGLPLKELALALGMCAFSVSTALPDGGPGRGTLGYGGHGLYPGFQGFGLGYHPGYGYGGKGLGVGDSGGYPFYGGPGYPHEAPCLRRCGGIAPFPYYGGPGPAFNVFHGVGPLVVDRPVVVVGDDRGGIGHADFGPFTGAIPYPDTFFAPNAAAASAAVSYGGGRP
jgi:hypothetical protein